VLEDPKPKHFIPGEQLAVPVVAHVGHQSAEPGARPRCNQEGADQIRIGDHRLELVL